MEFLDISLNTWSVVVFFFFALFLMSMTIAMFSGMNNIVLFFIVIFNFIIYNIVLVLYSISTSQIGFLLIVVFQFFLTVLTFLHTNQTMSIIDRLRDEDDN